MENKPETENEKKVVNKARSYNTEPLMNLRAEPVKRKSFSMNEAVMSLDLALGRLKKSKLVNGECVGASRAPSNATRHGCPSEMFMDLSSPSSNINPGITNASLMSMNFSHYELMRNLSRSTSNSDGVFSSTTCNTFRPSDNTLKDEHLEKYFRSVEMWNKKYRDGGGGPSVHFQLPEE